ncbi:hypothetical protein VKT23_001236 [Stygiomarasmius scandens]|uniref:Glucose-6-phosphate 1-epimerase n=1 Tax=Marasmiellus scandens TaxID=2682957 RepID=A0ABR1K9P6_9AGAR
MPVQQHDNTLILTHGKSNTKIFFYGATIVSWKCPDKRHPDESIERLFCSSKAALDGSKPIRGGIPVVFPCFGAPAHPDHMALSQHGFARNSVWKWDGKAVTDDDHSVSVHLTLEPTPEITEKYKKPFHLTYVVTLTEYELSTDLHVKNTSTSTAYPPDNLEFQALFHNYIRAPANQVLITPLKGLKYFDKVDTSFDGLKTEERAGVDVRNSTDSVYENAPGSYEVTWPGGGISIKTKALKDVVVWNPQAEAGKKIGDMEDGGWERYVCVEPGYVRGFEKIEPGRVWVGHQTLSVIHEERRLNL